MFTSIYFIILFIFLIITFCFREYFAFKRNLLFKYILTPTITILIICFAILSIDVNGYNTYTTLILIALVFSLTADVLLMIEEVNLLKHGIVFFIATHLLYIIAFLHNYSFQKWHIVLMLIFTFFFSLFFYKIRNKLDSFLYPVLVYVIIISIMGFSAYSRLSMEIESQIVFLIIGATLFMISDFLIAITVFVYPIPHSTVYTWALYAPAQFFIALSCY